MVDPKASDPRVAGGPTCATIQPCRSRSLRRRGRRPHHTDGLDRVTRALGGCQARSSFDRARSRLANLVATGVLTRQGVLRWTDELATIIVHGTPDAATALAERRLGPLPDASPHRERMLRDTLAAW